MPEPRSRSGLRRRAVELSHRKKKIAPSESEPGSARLGARLREVASRKPVTSRRSGLPVAAVAVVNEGASVLLLACTAPRDCKTWLGREKHVYFLPKPLRTALRNCSPASISIERRQSIRALTSATGNSESANCRSSVSVIRTVTQRTWAWAEDASGL